MKAILQKVWEYLRLKKRYKDMGEKDINLTFMHRMNRISIYVFLIGLVILLIKLFR